MQNKVEVVFLKTQEGNIVVENLPSELEPFLVNFKDEDKWDDPEAILKVMFTM